MARLLEDYFMASDGDGEMPRLSEPNVITTIFVSGVQATAEGPTIRLAFWDNITDHDGNPDSRVVERIAMIRSVGYGLYTQLHAIFGGEH